LIRFSNSDGTGIASEERTPEMDAEEDERAVVFREKNAKTITKSVIAMERMPIVKRWFREQPLELFNPRRRRRLL
jgi:hypothetical protein